MRKEYQFGLAVAGVAAIGATAIALHNSEQDTNAKTIEALKATNNAKQVIVVTSIPEPTNTPIWEETISVLKSITPVVVTATPTETVIPTEIAQAAIASVVTNTPITPEPTPTSTPTALMVQAGITEMVTATENTDQARKEVMGTKEITNWDGEVAIVSGITPDGLFPVIAHAEDLLSRGIIKEGDIRTFDKIRELKNEGGNHFFFIFSKDGQFPKAKDMVSLAEDQGRLILTNLGFQDIQADDARSLGLKMLGLTVNWSADGQTFFTRNTFPSANPKVAREDEKELEVCSVYDKTTKISEETMQGGLLHESNEASWVFAYNISPDGIKSKYPELKSISIKNADGQTVRVSWRLFDFGSQPNTKANMIAPDNFKQFVWGSEIKKPCGPAIPPTKLMVQAGFTPGSTQPGQPPEQKTPPPSFPSPMATNADHFPVNTPQPVPTSDIKPTRAG